MFNFPWSNFHELNLDWILSVVKEAKEIFVKGEGDIQHAVETADQALETAEQAAAGVIADGAVTIPKLNSEVYSLFAYCVSGSVAPNFIPAGALVILRKSTIYNVTDGIYTATRNIPQAAIITAADLDQSATLYREGGMNYLLHNEEKLSGTIDLIKAGLVILVSGDEASAAVPADGLVYVANNTHGLNEGFYFNSSGATFPPTGGTADSDSFTAVNNILNALQTAVATLGSDDIANDSTVTGASVTDALDAVKNTLTQLENKHRKFIFVGDSYGESSSFAYPVWTELVPSYLSLGNGDYYAKGVSGAGFVGSNATFLSVLQSISVSEPDEITDIYVLGGINDNGSSVSNIVAAISAFMTYAKATYIKAQVHIGIISCTTSATVQYNMRTVVVPAYMQSPVYGASFVNGMDFIADYELLNNDGTHPTQAGQEVLSKYIADYIIGGYSGTSHPEKNVTITPYEGSLYGADTLRTYEKNGLYTMRLDGGFTTVTFNTNKSIGTVTLFNVPNNKGVFPHGDGNYYTPVSFNIRRGSDVAFNPTVYNGILIYDGVNGVIKLYYPVFVALTDVNAVLLNTFTFTGVTYLD